MKKLIFPIFLFLIQFFISCSNQEAGHANNLYLDFPSFMKGEIAKLGAQKMTLEKTMIKGEKVNTERIDSVDWNRELELLNRLDLNKSKGNPPYLQSTDSSKQIRIESFQVKDTSNELRSMRFTYVNGVMELVEAELVKHSWILDRATKLSYQPGKGFGMIVKEDYIWSKPATYEIYGQINNPTFLKR